MERQVLVDARHPLVAPLYAAFQDCLYLYLEMEYCPGGSLDNFLRHAYLYLHKTAVVMHDSMFGNLLSKFSFEHVIGTPAVVPSCPP